MKHLMYILFLSGCYANPISTIKTDNKDIDVKLLFSHEGCSVYRFEDAGTHYYTNCGETISIKTCGKGCRYNENIQSEK